MSDTTFIYALKEPDTGEIRYIGQTGNMKRRLREHVREAKKKKTHKECWIFSLLESGQRPVLEVLDEVPDDLYESAEMGYVFLYKSQGCRLVNGTPGGDGVSLPGELNPCAGKFGEAHPAFGRIVSEQEREATSRRFTGVPKSPEHKAKLSLANTGKKQPPRSAEWMENLSEALTGHEISLDTRKKIGDANRGKQRTLEQCEKISQALTGKKRGPYKKKNLNVLH